MRFARASSLRATAVLALLPLVSACSGMAQVISAATTSPGEKTCRVYITYQDRDEAADGASLRVATGLSGHKTDMTSKIVKVRHPSGPILWRLRGDYYRSVNTPCIAEALMTIAIESERQAFRGVIPINTLLSEPVWGDLRLKVSGQSATLWLAENLGKTRYAAAPMTNVWALEPERKLYEIELLAADK